MGKKPKTKQPEIASRVRATKARSTLTVATAKTQLADFLAHNKSASIDASASASFGSRIIVKNPWGDDSLVLDLPEDFEDLAQALNNVILPERFNGLYHRDLKALELLWTPFALRGARSDIKGRSFQYTQDGKKYRCEFSRSSE